MKFKIGDKVWVAGTSKSQYNVTKLTVVNQVSPNALRVQSTNGSLWVVNPNHLFSSEKKALEETARVLKHKMFELEVAKSGLATYYDICMDSLDQEEY